jgi:signal transduction histidine kinase
MDDMDGIEKMMNQSFRIRDSLQILPGIIANKIMLGELYLRKEDTSKALPTIMEAYNLSRKIGSSADILKTLKLLMDNDYANENYYKKVFFKVNDSIQNIERITRNKFARIAYETDQIVEKNELFSKRNLYILLVSTILMITGIVLFIIFRLKGRNKELIYSKEQQEANKKIYQLMLHQQSQNELAKKEGRNRIAMELHDGIVNSIFTIRFNLAELDSNKDDKKQQLIAELKKTEEEVRRVLHDLQQNLLFEDKNLP